MTGYDWDALKVADYVLFDAARERRNDLPKYLQKPAEVLRKTQYMWAHLQCSFWHGGEYELTHWTRCTKEGVLLESKGAQSYTRRLFREGSFHAHFPDVERRCGPRGVTEFLYEVLIETQKLNRHGYVFDQEEIERYWLRTYSGSNPVLTCEEIAERACEYFKRALESSQQPQLIRVRFAPMGAARWTEAEWKPTARR